MWLFVCFQVIVQNYNSVLTLSHLYQSSDALLVHENDVIHKICAQLMNIKQISFRDVNQVIAHQLGSVFQPTHTAGEGSGYSRNPLGTEPNIHTHLSGVSSAVNRSSSVSLLKYLDTFQVLRQEKTNLEVQSQCCSKIKNRSPHFWFHSLPKEPCFSFFKWSQTPLYLFTFQRKFVQGSNFGLIFTFHFGLEVCMNLKQTESFVFCSGRRGEQTTG